jgi:hypothetical protein
MGFSRRWTGPSFRVKSTLSRPVHNKTERLVTPTLPPPHFCNFADTAYKRKRAGVQVKIMTGEQVPHSFRVLFDRPAELLEIFSPPKEENRL